MAQRSLLEIRIPYSLKKIKILQNAKLYDHISKTKNEVIVTNLENLDIEKHIVVSSTIFQVVATYQFRSYIQLKRLPRTKKLTILSFTPFSHTYNVISILAYKQNINNFYLSFNIIQQIYPNLTILYIQNQTDGDTTTKRTILYQTKRNTYTKNNRIIKNFLFVNLKIEQSQKKRHNQPKQKFFQYYFFSKYYRILLCNKIVNNHQT
eukprot:TRINITY_DN8064_c0_g1_i4.p1 TRINITY_DN8064_c0_g1~~TRINITY_DN8064_c0_g1_i4.p1  ORF type:complete len:207 (+),score=-18.75 TRINITY_DN8064_c0_g1_i4:567-1187(+)